MTESGEAQLQMSFWEHLAELRSRLAKAMLAFVAGGVLAWFYKEQLLAWVATPFVTGWYDSIEGDAPSLHFSTPGAFFFAYLRLAMLAGLLFALPIIFYQVWAFIAPGLYSKERRVALPFVFCSSGLFIGGAYYGWRFAYPMAFTFLLKLSGKIEGSGIAIDVKPTVMVDKYIDFVTQMSVALGAVFELPVLAFFLSFTGVINYRHLVKFFRYFVVIAFLIAAIISPPDPVSQFAIAIPLCLLYGFSIGVAYVFGRKPEETNGPDAEAAP